MDQGYILAYPLPHQTATPDLSHTSQPKRNCWHCGNAVYWENLDPLPALQESHNKNKNNISQNFSQLKKEIAPHTSDTSWNCPTLGVLPH